ncbi:hypothetical protein [Nocardia sp. AG03]|uniref:hypothetical protein n=1 Tax=Nocardia sp. AG03 TaxID=3025312 RepID=UPI002418668C|nr:hypothetical protein [Nocardia sp. AG03]
MFELIGPEAVGVHRWQITERLEQLVDRYGSTPTLPGWLLEVLVDSDQSDLLHRGVLGFRTAPQGRSLFIGQPQSHSHTSMIPRGIT